MRRPRFLRLSMFARSRASEKDRSSSWRSYGIRRVGDLARLDEAFLESLLGKWGLALAGKAHGLDAGGYFEGEVGDHDDPKSISHEHTFGEDTPGCRSAGVHAGEVVADGRPAVARA